MSQTELAEGWLEARGSRPSDLRDTDVFEFIRGGRPLGSFAAGEFNWDLWCHYRPAPGERSRLKEKMGGTRKFFRRSKRSS